MTKSTEKTLGRTCAYIYIRMRPTITTSKVFYVVEYEFITGAFKRATAGRYFNWIAEPWAHDANMECHTCHHQKNPEKWGHFKTLAAASVISQHRGRIQLLFPDLCRPKWRKRKDYTLVYFFRGRAFFKSSECAFSISKHLWKKSIARHFPLNRNRLYPLSYNIHLFFIFM